MSSQALDIIWALNLIFFHVTGASQVTLLVKNLPANEGDARDAIPGSGRSPGEGHGNPLQYSCLENPHAQRSLAGYSPWGYKQSDMTDHAHSSNR